jgi:hypothetical protein
VLSTVAKFFHTASTLGRASRRSQALPDVDAGAAFTGFLRPPSTLHIDDVVEDSDMEELACRPAFLFASSQVGSAARSVTALQRHPMALLDDLTARPCPQDPNFTLLHYVALLGCVTLSEALERANQETLSRYNRFAR